MKVLAIVPFTRSGLPEAIRLSMLIVFLWAACGLPSNLGAEDTRDWKTRDGKYEVRAVLVESKDDVVTLRRGDGERVTVPLERLSDDDIQFVRQWLAARSMDPVPGIVPDVLGPPVDLLKLINPEENVLRGTVRRQGQTLITDPEKRTVAIVPYEVPRQYRLRMVTKRTGSTTSCSIALPIGDHQALVVIDSGYGKKSGLVWIDGRNEPANETYYRKTVLTTDQVSEIVCSVYRSGIHVMRDGETIVQWFGDPARLSLDQRWWSGTPTDRLMIGSYASAYEIVEFELKPIERSSHEQLQFKGMPPEPSQSVALIEHPTASGTGFLAAPNLLVTNAHVISGSIADELNVFFPRQSDPLKVNAVLWVDEQHDLAVLSVSSDHVPLPLALDGHYAKGESVVVLGNPSVGGGAVLRNARVEGTLRSTLRIGNVDLIQIDASVNSGSSGGPILNALGQVVGVTVMKATEEGETMIRQGLRRLDDSIRSNSVSDEERGIAFAVPGQDLVRALDQVRTMDVVDAARTTDLHDARTVYQRLAILADIRKLQAFANIPDQMRRQESTARLAGNLRSNSLVELMPAAAAREINALLRSEPIRALIGHCEDDLTKHLNHVASSDHLSDAIRRDFRTMAQRIGELEALAKRPGTDYQRFSSAISRIQSSLDRSRKRIEETL